MRFQSRSPASASPGVELWRLLVRYATLAPSGHNTQPWRFVVDDRAIDLYADRRRALPVADPGDRELAIACGAALLNLRVAAGTLGYPTRVLPWPDPAQPDWVARVALAETAIAPRSFLTPDPADGPPRLGDGLGGDLDATERDRLFRAIPQRHTNRTGFADRPVSEALQGELAAAAAAEGAGLALLPLKRDRRPLAEAIAEGDREQWRDRAFRRELAAWVRQPKGEAGDGLSAPCFGAPAWTTVPMALALRTFDRGRVQARTDFDAAIAAPVLAVLTSPGDGPEDWLRAGAALERVLLRAADSGLSARYWNQPVQVRRLRSWLADWLADRDLGRPGDRRDSGAAGAAESPLPVPQMVVGMGYGSAPVRAPRRPVAAVVAQSAALAGPP